QRERSYRGGLQGWRPDPAGGARRAEGLPRDHAAVYHGSGVVLARPLPAERGPRQTGAAVSPAPPSSREHPRAPRWSSSWVAALRQAVALVLSLAATGGLLLFLLWSPFDNAEPPAPRPAAPGADEAAQLVGSRALAIRPDSVLAKKLTVVKAQRRKVSAPVM